MNNIVVSAAALICLLFMSACQNGNKVEFNVEAGEASKTLKVFARQAGVELLLSEKELDGVKTRAVSGSMNAPDALQKMIAGTGLIFNRDEETNAFAVSFPRDE